MEPIEEIKKNPHYVVLVARLPTQEDHDRDSLMQSAKNVHSRFPILSTARVVTVDSKPEKLTVEILKEAWGLSDGKGKISYNELFSSMSFRDHQKAFIANVQSYLEWLNGAETPLVIIGSTFALSAILDILRIEKKNISLTMNSWIVTIDTSENNSLIDVA